MNIFGIHICMDEINMVIMTIVPHYHVAVHYLYRLLRYLPGM